MMRVTSLGIASIFNDNSKFDVTLKMNCTYPCLLQQFSAENSHQNAVIALSGSITPTLG